MIDAQTRNPLRIGSDEIAPPSLPVPVDQLDAVRDRLNRHSIASASSFAKRRSPARGESVGREDRATCNDSTCAASKDRTGSWSPENACERHGRPRGTIPENRSTSDNPVTR
jgi:hypothetical protein